MECTDVTSEDNNITSKLDVRTIESCRVDDKLATEIADFFRLQFSAAPYYHFTFHESDPLQSLPQNLDYAAYAVSTALSDETKRRACQDTLRDMAYRNTLGAITSPPCESTRLPKGFHHWTDKEICRQQTKDRLSDPGYVTPGPLWNSALRNRAHSQYNYDRSDYLWRPQKWASARLLQTNLPSVVSVRNRNICGERRQVRRGIDLGLIPQQTQEAIVLI